jgi:hypothetical protein
MNTWPDTCSCGSTRFWLSRSGYKICFDCCPDPFSGLTVLARRGGPSAVPRVEGWWHGTEDSAEAEQTAAAGAAVEKRLESAEAEAD